MQKVCVCVAVDYADTQIYKYCILMDFTQLFQPV